MTDGLTEDGFLGGRLVLTQPARGYRAGVDPVLLAASVAAKAGQSVLELGCGVGAALLCLGVRVPGLDLTGVEVQGDYAELARLNAARAGITARIETADLRTLPADLRNMSFDQVLANPPYFEPARGSGSDDGGKDVAFRGDTPLADWITVAGKRLKPKGCLTMILRAERLPGLLSSLPGDLGSVQVRPVAGREGRDADRVLIRARKAGRAPFRLLAPLILHDGPVHAGDSESYRAEIAAVLREAAPLAVFCD